MPTIKPEAVFKAAECIRTQTSLTRDAAERILQDCAELKADAPEHRGVLDRIEADMGKALDFVRLAEGHAHGLWRSTYVAPQAGRALS